MSLIYLSKAPEEQSTSCVIDRLYDRIFLHGNGRGRIRLDIFLKTGGPIRCLELALPYPQIERYRCSNDELEDETRKGIHTQSITLPGLTRVQMKPLKPRDLSGIRYSVFGLELGDGSSGDVCFSLEFFVKDVAYDVTRGKIRNRIFESTWSADVTLYGPINPRSHVFIDKDTLANRIVKVDHGYLYIYLPSAAFPRFVLPETLEMFFDEDEDRFYLSWTIGRLESWYEQRVLVIYSRLPSGYALAFLISLLTSLIATAVILGVQAVH